MSMNVLPKTACVYVFGMMFRTELKCDHTAYGMLLLLLVVVVTPLTPVALLWAKVQKEDQAAVGRFLTPGLRNGVGGLC